MVKSLFSNKHISMRHVIIRKTVRSSRRRKASLRRRRFGKAASYRARFPRRGGRTQVSRRYAARATNDGQPMQIAIGRPQRRTARRVGRFRNRVVNAITPVHKWGITDWGLATANDGECRYFIASSQLLATGDRRGMATLSGASVSDEDTTRYIIKDMSLTTQISNASTQSVYVRVYYMSARRDVPTDNTSAAELGETVNTASNPSIGRLYTGFLDNALPNTQTVTDLSLTLFSNPYICSYFKIKKVETYQMAPGANKEFKINVNKPRYINNEVFADTQYPRGAPLLVFQMWGSVGSVPVVGNVSTTLARVNFVTKRLYNYQYVSPNRSRVSHSDNLPTQAFGSLSIVNPDTAAIQVENAI